jgi:kumamolisin
MFKPYYRVLKEYSFNSNVVNPVYTPVDLKRIYNFPANYNGSGQTVAFIELGGGFVQRDLDNYFSSLGLNSNPVQFVSVDGGINHPTNANSDDVEVMLDLCVAIGVANGITPKVYMAPNSFKGFVDAVARAIVDKVNVISISWGASERSWTTSQRNLMNSTLLNASNQGITVCCASGDNGSSDGGSGNNVDFPGSSPYVLCCGGTTCVASNGVILNETVWNDAYGATGGGVSSFFAKPSYQPQNNIYRNQRGVPDVASDADPATGIRVITDGQNLVVGGTSASAPFWAGVVAVLNQALNRKLGFINPVLYPILNYNGNIKPFHDITSGNNGAYSAVRGWDACTGLGTPDVSNLLNYLRTH